MLFGTSDTVESLRVRQDRRGGGISIEGEIQKDGPVRLETEINILYLSGEQVNSWRTERGNVVDRPAAHQIWDLLWATYIFWHHGRIEEDVT